MVVGSTTTSGSSKKARKTYLKMVQNVQLTSFVPKIARVDNPIIGFLEEDAQSLHHLHDDALVNIPIGDYNTHRVLVDNGSSIDILYYPAFQQMRIERKRLVPNNAPLVGFGGTKVYPLGAIILLVTVGDYSQQITKDITFLIVNYLSAYNAILARPNLNSWKAVTSTYHLMIKFPTEYGVGKVHRDQVAAHECYIAMLEIDDHLQTMSIEEQRAVTELVEGLEEILLDNFRPEQTTRIGTFASPPVRQALTAFLKENQDVFACSHENLPRIDLLIMVHRLMSQPLFLLFVKRNECSPKNESGL